MICHKDGSSKSRLPKLVCAAPYPKQQIQTHAPPIGGAFLLRRGGAAASCLSSLLACLLLPSRFPAGRAAHGLFFKAFFPEKQLLCLCKHEFIAAVPADQHLITHLLFLHFPPLTVFDSPAWAYSRSARTRHFCRTRYGCRAA